MLAGGRDQEFSFTHAGGEGEGGGRGPGIKIESGVRGGLDFQDVHVLDAQWFAPFADFGAVVQGHEVGGALAKNFGVARGVEEDCGGFVDADAVDLGGPAVLNDAREEGDGTAEAFALGEVAISEDAFHSGLDEEIAAEGDEGVVGIRERFVAGDGIDHRGKNEFSLNGEAGADAADGEAAGEGGVDDFLDRGVSPVADVIRLITAGKVDAVGGAEFFGDEGRHCAVAGSNDQSGDAVSRANFVELGIVFVGFGGAEDDDVAPSGVGAEDAGGFVDVAVAAKQERDVRGRGGRDWIFCGQGVGRVTVALGFGGDGCGPLGLGVDQLSCCRVEERDRECERGYESGAGNFQGGPV